MSTKHLATLLAAGTPPLNSTSSSKSLSDERAVKAQEWVEKEVAKLVDQIQETGRTQGNEVHVTFGELLYVVARRFSPHICYTNPTFSYKYQDVSDTLVGILARAKKRNLVKYEGEGGSLLLQGHHDKVIITLDLAKAAAWKKEMASRPPSSSPTTANNTPSPSAKPTLKQMFEEEKKAKATPSPQPSPPKPEIKHISTPPSSKHESTGTPTTPATTGGGFFDSLVDRLRPSSSTAATTPPTPAVQAPPPPTPEPTSKTTSTNGDTEESGIFASLLSKITAPRSSVPAATSTRPPSSQQLPPTPQTTTTTPSNNDSPSSLTNMAKDYITSVTSALLGNGTSTESPKNNSTPPPPMTKPLPHAALPQRTHGGTRGAVLHHSPPTSTQHRAVNSQPKPSPVLAAAHDSHKKQQDEFVKKHMQRGVVTQPPSSSSSSAKSGSVAARTAAFNKKNQDVQAANAVKTIRGTSGNKS